VVALRVDHHRAQQPDVRPAQLKAVLRCRGAASGSGRRRQQAEGYPRAHSPLPFALSRHGPEAAAVPCTHSPVRQSRGVTSQLQAWQVPDERPAQAQERPVPEWRPSTRLATVHRASPARAQRSLLAAPAASTRTPRLPARPLRWRTPAGPTAPATRTLPLPCPAHLQLPLHQPLEQRRHGGARRPANVAAARRRRLRPPRRARDQALEPPLVQPPVPVQPHLPTPLLSAAALRTACSGYLRYPHISAKVRCAPRSTCLGHSELQAPAAAPPQAGLAQHSAAQQRWAVSK